jgi:precorrin-4 methylase
VKTPSQWPKTHYPCNTLIAIVSEAGSIQKQSVLQGTLDIIVAKIGNGKLQFQHLIYVGVFLR